MNLDNINPDEPTVMTAELVRLFKAAGCSPTACHACYKEIKAGATFKLVPHKKYGVGLLTDEMVCGKCGPPELVARDRRAHAALHRSNRRGDSYDNGGGYSRPSRVLGETK